MTDLVIAGLGEPLLDAKAVADFLGVTKHTVYRKAGKPRGIPCVRVGSSVRFRPSDVRQYVEQGRMENSGGDKARRLLSAGAIERARAKAAAAIAQAEQPAAFPQEMSS